jgi:hypothetical protein
VDRRLAVAVVLTALALAFALVLARDAWRVWQPARHLLAGRWAEARAAAARVERSWLRLLPGVRQSSRYALACALHLEGKLEDSLAATRALRGERLRPNARYAVCSLEAATLVLLDRDAAGASALLDEAARVRRAPEDLLLAAHAKAALGEADAARALFDAAGEQRARDRPARLALGRTRRESRRQQEAIFHALRGLWLARVGRDVEAQRDLAIAARSPIANVYVARARARFDSRAPEPEPPSSLDPQVVATRT